MRVWTQAPTKVAQTQLCCTGMLAMMLTIAHCTEMHFLAVLTARHPSLMLPHGDCAEGVACTVRTASKCLSCSLKLGRQIHDILRLNMMKGLHRMDKETVNSCHSMDSGFLFCRNMAKLLECSLTEEHLLCCRSCSSTEPHLSCNKCCLVSSSCRFASSSHRLVSSNQISSSQHS